MTDTIIAGLVKPLEWKDYSAPHRAIYSATPPCGIYRITQRHFPEMHYTVETPTGMSISESTLKDAQDAAQAYHAARVLASLHTDKLRALVEALTDARDMLTGCTFQTMRINGRYIDRDETVANADAALAALQEPEP